MWRAQCGLCLSCGAPFEPKAGEVSFYNRKANLSILYLNEEYMHNRVIQSNFEKPKFCSVKEESHIVHRSHHGAAVRYMSKFHEGDSNPKYTYNAAGVGTLDGSVKNGPMPYYSSETGKSGPCVAVWDKPSADSRVDLSSLLEFAQSYEDDQPVATTQNLDLTFAICKACNSLMTGLAYTRFLIGFATVADKNPNTTIIPAGVTPVHVRAANARNTDLERAMGRWTYARADGESDMPARDASDHIAPFVAYYLHACLPYARNVREFPIKREGARCFYVEMSWILLEIAAIGCLIDQGKQNASGKLSHGLQQHYGVLDLYISYFLWRMIRYELVKRRSLLSFVQWHQKYFWDAINIPSMHVRGISTIGLMVIGDTRVATADLVSNICDTLCSLYSTTFSSLIDFAVDLPIRKTDSDARFVQQYFISPKSVQALGRRWTKVCMFISYCLPLLIGFAGDR